LDTIVLTEKKSNLVAGSLVLVVEDDHELAENIRLELQAVGHLVQVAETLTNGLRAARSSDAAALVIDRILHREDALSIVEVLRGEGNSTPILVISGLTSVDERIAGFKAGCDDYLVKPFDVRELTARVEALLRRGNESAIRLRVGDLEMDLVGRTVRREGELVNLLPMEFKLLEYFIRRAGQTVTRAMLLDDVWSSRSLANTNTVDVQIGNLRRKLDPTGSRHFIVNVRSVGFKLNADH
jgi:two-component system OmpR family response regulator